MRRNAILVGCAWVVALGAAPWSLPAQASGSGFDRFTAFTSERGGLSQNAVRSAVEDPDGFLWLATQDGLDRFDGYQFRTFQHRPGDSLSLPASQITALLVDSKGRLWVGTQAGLALYEPSTESFVTVPVLTEERPAGGRPPALALEEDRAGRLWVGTSAGLALLAVEGATSDLEVSGRWLHRPDDVASLSHSRVLSLHATPDALWIGTVAGLDRLDLRTLEVTRFTDPASLARGFPVREVLCFFEHPSGDLWMGTGAGRLLALDRQRLEITEIGNGQWRRGIFAIAEVGSSTSSQSDEAAAHRRLWIGSFGEGIAELAHDGRLLRRTRHDLGDPTSLSDDRVISIFRDRSGLVWVGTDSGGVNRLDARQARFGLIRAVPSRPDALRDPVVRSILVEPDGTLWVGSYGGAADGGVLHRRPPGERDFVTYQHRASDPASPPSGRMEVLLRDRQGDVWVGTDGGLARYDRGQSGFERIDSPTDERGSLCPDVLSLDQDRAGVLWAGTSRGPCALDRDRRRLEPRALGSARVDPAGLDTIRDFFEDSTGALWLATHAGVYRYSADRASAEVFRNDPDDAESLGRDVVFQVLEQPPGTLWLATYGSGVARLELGERRFRHLTSRDGLPNDVINCMLTDGAGQLWVSTNRGLARFDPDASSIAVFGPADGLQGLEFSTGACFRSADGRLWFGGLQGLNGFDPAEADQEGPTPKVLLTDLRVLNRSVAIDSEGMLPRAIGRTDELVLPWHADVVSFDFAALALDAPESILYSYRLEGLGRDWVETDARRRFATFTDLPPGHYRLRVRARRPRGEWSADEASLAIQVRPPPWRSKTAYGLYLLSAVAMIGGYVGAQRRTRRRLESTVAARTRELTQVNLDLEATGIQLAAEKRAAEEANRLKSAFLAFMSHEIRTPMNGVLGMAELMLRTPLEPDQRSFVESIKASGRDLISVLSDLLDYSKLEAGAVEPESIAFDLRDLVGRLELLLQPRAAENGLAFTVSVDDAVPEALRGDANRIRQVLLNLLSNAVKFTEKGRVDLRIAAVAQEAQEAESASRCTVSFEVTDTGIGISATALEHLFEPFRQADNSISRRYGGTGLGLAICRETVQAMGGVIEVESEPGRGSRFRVRLGLEAATRSELLASDVSSAGEAALQARIDPLEILLAEDHDTSREVARQLLEQAGHRVSAISDGAEALAAIEAADGRRFDVVLMDVHMPGVDGLEAARRIRDAERDGSFRLPLIAVTAGITTEELARCTQAGFDDVVIKPIEAAKLDQALARIHGSSRGARSPSKTSGRSVDEASSLLDLELVATHLEKLGADRMAGLIKQASESSRQELDRIQRSRAAGDAVAVVEAAHRLAGLAASFGLRALHESALSLEREADRALDSEATAELVAGLDVLCELSLRQLHEVVEEK